MDALLPPRRVLNFVETGGGRSGRQRPASKISPIFHVRHGRWPSRFLMGVEVESNCLKIQGNYTSCAVFYPWSELETRSRVSRWTLMGDFATVHILALSITHIECHSSLKICPCCSVYKSMRSQHPNMILVQGSTPKIN